MTQWLCRDVAKCLRCLGTSTANRGDPSDDGGHGRDCNCHNNNPGISGVITLKCKCTYSMQHVWLYHYWQYYYYYQYSYYCCFLYPLWVTLSTIWRVMIAIVYFIFCQYNSIDFSLLILHLPFFQKTAKLFSSFPATIALAVSLPLATWSSTRYYSWMV